MSRKNFSFQSILNGVGRAFSQKLKQNTSTVNEKEDAAGVDVSQAVSAEHPSKSTECLSATQVPPVTFAASNMNTSKASASTLFPHRATHLSSPFHIQACN